MIAKIRVFFDATWDRRPKLFEAMLVQWSEIRAQVGFEFEWCDQPGPGIIQLSCQKESRETAIELPPVDRVSVVVLPRSSSSEFVNELRAFHEVIFWPARSEEWMSLFYRVDRSMLATVSKELNLQVAQARESANESLDQLKRLHAKRLASGHKELRFAQAQARYYPGSSRGGDYFDVLEDQKGEWGLVVVLHPGNYGYTSDAIEVLMRIEREWARERDGRIVNLFSKDGPHNAITPKRVYERLLPLIRPGQLMSLFIGAVHWASGKIEYLSYGDVALIAETVGRLPGTGTEISQLKFDRDPKVQSAQLDSASRSFAVATGAFARYIDREFAPGEMVGELKGAFQELPFFAFQGEEGQSLRDNDATWYCITPAEGASGRREAI